MSYERAWVVGVLGRAMVKRAPNTDTFIARESVVKVRHCAQRTVLQRAIAFYRLRRMFANSESIRASATCR
jgi:hypothetical protein